jgi:hypothetical protein
MFTNRSPFSVPRSVPPLVPLPERAPVVEQERPKRCCFDGCKKKLTLTDFPCKCSKIHCSAHRASEAHACSYDYRSEQKDILMKTMSTPVVAKKVEVI